MSNKLQDYAKQLYLHTDHTQKEIAEKVGKTEQTLSIWKTKGKWAGLKAALTVTKEQQLQRIYGQINELTTFIQAKEKGQRFASSAEADTLTKLAGIIGKLENEAGLKETVGVFMSFSHWLRNRDIEAARTFASLQDEYIKGLIK